MSIRGFQWDESKEKWILNQSEPTNQDNSLVAELIELNISERPKNVSLKYLCVILFNMYLLAVMFIYTGGGANEEIK